MPPYVSAIGRDLRTSAPAGFRYALTSTALVGLLTAVILSAARPALAQPEYLVHHLGEEDGLTDARLNFFYGTDALGFTWISSMSGPFRYDGHGLRHFPVDSTGVVTDANNVQSDFYTDGAGMLWFSTVSDLVRFDPDTEEMRRWRMGEDALHLFDLDVARGELWLSDGQAIWRADVDDPSSQTPRVPVTGARFVREALPDGGTRVTALRWIVGPGATVLTLGPRGELESRREAADRTVAEAQCSSGVVTASGEVYLSSDVGLLHYDPVTDRTLGTYVVPGRTYPGLFQVRTADTLLVAGSSTGASWFSPRRRAFLGEARAAPGSNRALARDVYTAYVNREGVFFGASRGGGVEVGVPVRPTFSELRAPGSSRAEPVATSVGPGGRFLLLRLDGTLEVFGGEGAFDRRIDPPASLTSLVEAPLAVDHHGGVWLCDDRAVYKLDAARSSWERRYRHDGPLHGVYVGDTGSVLLLGAGGLLRLRETGVESVAGWRASSFTRQRILGLGQGRWAHLMDAGGQVLLYVLRGARAELTDTLVVPTSRVLATSATDPTRLLLPTNTGVVSAEISAAGLVGEPREALRAPSTWVAYGTAASLYAVADDGLHVREGGVRRVYTRRDGFRRGRPPRAYLSATPRRLYVGGDYGVLSASLPLAPPSTSTTRVYLERAWVNDLPVEKPARGGSAGLRLGPTDQSFEVAIAAVSAPTPAPRRFAYRLVGLDTAWRTTASGRVRYERLPAGEYRLEVHTDTPGSGPETALAFPIVAEGPLYTRWWFLALIGLAVAALVGGVTYAIQRRRLLTERRRRARDAALAAERDRIARELHDDLGGGLASILFLSDGDGPTDRRIAELSRASLDNMRDIVWALGAQDGVREDLRGRIVTAARRMCADRDVDFRLREGDGGGGGGEGWSSAERRNLLLIVKEAVHNALRHGAPATVTLEVETWASDAIALRVSDDGAGFEVGQSSVTAGGVGLRSMRKRATEIGLRLRVTSTPGEGTTVEVTKSPGAA